MRGYEIHEVKLVSKHICSTTDELTQRQQMRCLCSFSNMGSRGLFFFQRKAYWSCHCVHDESVVEGRFYKCYLCIKVI